MLDKKNKSWIAFLHMARSVPTLKEIREFEQSDIVRSFTMNEEDTISHLTGRQDRSLKGSYMDFDTCGRSTVFPVKVFNKNNKLVRTISVKKVKELSDASFTKSTWNGKKAEYKNKYGNAGNREEKK